MTIEITWTITAIIAVSSFFSPIAVAIINNRHHAKMRKMELEHDRTMYQLKLQEESILRQSQIYYSDKKTAFSEFTGKAGLFSMGKQSRNDYENLLSSINNALLFCSHENQMLLCEFQNYVDTKCFGYGYSAPERSEYAKKLNNIALSLNKELESTKPVIDCKCGKH